MPGFKTIIALSFTLSIGILLTILSCALYDSNWLPFTIIIPYLFAPLPNLITRRLGCHDTGLFAADQSSGILETGHFITSFLIVSGIAIPFMLVHSEKIQFGAFILSSLGGPLIYLAIIGYITFFGHDDSQGF